MIDAATRCAAAVDPADHSAILAATARMNDIDLQQVWVTHKHDDHSGGLLEVTAAYKKKGTKLQVYVPSGYMCVSVSVSDL